MTSLRKSCLIPSDSAAYSTRIMTSAWDIPNFFISMSHELSSDFDIRGNYATYLN